MIEFLLGAAAGVAFHKYIGLDWLARFRKDGLGDADEYKVGGTD